MVLFAVIACVVCGLCNIFNISLVGKVNLIMVIFMAAALVVYAAFGFSASDFAHFVPFFSQGYGGSTGWIMAVPNAMLAYGGIVALVSVSSDIENPKKTIPRAMIISMVSITVLYILVIAATAGMVGTEVFIESPELQYYPLYSAIAMALPNDGWIASLISIAALLALFTTILVLIMSSANTIAVAAQSGFLPEFLGKYNEKTKTPVNSIVLTTIIVSVIACFPQFVTQITSTGAVAMVVTVALLAYTLLKARKKIEPEEGNFRLPGGNALPIAIVVILALFLVLQEVSAMVLCGLWFVVGFIIYGIAARKIPKGE